MKSLIVIITSLNVMFLIMHEYDAFYRGEWKMFKFINKLKDSTQFLIFFYLHIPITLLCLYYFWTTINFNNFLLWIIINIFSILHLIIHLIARMWNSNVFKSINSFFIIAGSAITGLINLIIFRYY